MVADRRNAMNGTTRANSAQRRASDPSASAWVNANAGSGKTHVLIDRLIRLMLAGNEPSRILCLTYTKAAAAEMSNRLFDRLGQWTTLPDAKLHDELAATGVTGATPETLAAARRLFATALETPGGLKIQTIHAFCERLLQLFPVEAGIVPRFTVMDDRKAAELMELARNDTLAAAARLPDSALGRSMAAIAGLANADQFDGLLKALVAGGAAIQGFLVGETGTAALESALRLLLDLQPTDDMDSVMADLALDRGSYQDFARALTVGTASDQKRDAMIDEALSSPRPDLTMLRGLYLTTTDDFKKPASIATKTVMANADWLGDFIAKEQQRLATGLGKLADLRHVAATVQLLTVAAAVEQAYAQGKRARGAYDFSDLIFHTQQLLAAKPDAAWVLYKLDGGIEHVLLDEAQDTSPAQWSIITSLTDEFFAGAGRPVERPRTLFAVGDRKQSIFSFQGADPAIFETVHKAFKEKITGDQQVFNDVDFTVSFRSTPAVLNAVDAVFAEGTRARLGLDGHLAGLTHEARRSNHPGAVELWPLVEPVENDEAQPWQAPVDRPAASAPHVRLARSIAERIKSWIGTRLIPDRNEASKHPVTAGDILILVRKRGLLFDALIRELRNAGLPVAGADRLQLGDNLAVADLLALARFVLLEADDYSLACVLKSPVPGQPFDEDALFAVAHGRGDRSLWESLKTTGAPVVGELEGLIRLARTARPYEFFATVLANCRQRMISRLGGEANDALDAFLEQAIAHEQEGNSSLQGFVQWFSAGSSEIKRDMEQAAGEVRVMTVHGAKGLEAPIVFLPDTTGQPEPRKDALMIVDVGRTEIRLPLWRLPGQFESAAMARLVQARSGEAGNEHRRLLYVAMTRARDELYVMGYRGQRKIADDCWYTLVEETLKPRMREVGDGIFRAGDDPVLTEAARSGAPTAVTVPDWVGGQLPAEPLGPVFAAPSKLAGGLTAEPGPAAARGTLIHAILQLLPDTPENLREALIRRMVARAGESPDVVREILTIAADPDLAFLFGPDGLSEVPVRAGLDGRGQPLSGRIDRLILGTDTLTVIDYKTDRSPPEVPEAMPQPYLAQMGAYWAALRQIHPHHDIRCVILWTAAPRLMQIPPALLGLHNPVARP
jgi:ATP-dependent helicase/nuclease subunit A